MNFDKYMKKNHFKYILSELQGKETIHISDDEINKIVMLIRNKRKTDVILGGSKSAPVLSTIIHFLCLSSDKLLC